MSYCRIVVFRFSEYRRVGRGTACVLSGARGQGVSTCPSRHEEIQAVEGLSDREVIAVDLENTPAIFLALAACRGMAVLEKRKRCRR